MGGGVGGAAAGVHGGCSGVEILSTCDIYSA